MRIPWLGLPARSGRLVLVGLIDSTGTGLFIAGAAVFYTQGAGLSIAQVGIGLTVAGLCGLLALTPLGMLADRIGPRPAAVLLHFWRAAGFVAFAFVHDFVTFLVVACVVGIPARAVDPVNQMFVDRHIGKEQRTRVMAAFRVVANVGFTLGALLATVIIAIGTRPAFVAIVLGDALTFVLAGILLTRVPLLADHTPARPTVRGWPTSLRQGRFLAVAALHAVFVLHIPLLSIGIPLWATQHTTAPALIVGPLIVLNTILVILFQVRCSRGTETRAGGIRALRLASVSLAGCAAVVAFAGETGTVLTVVLLAAGMVLLTFGELFQVAGGVSVSYDLAPRDRQGEYLAVFSLGTAAMYMVGPVLVTIGIVERGPVGWLALAAVFLAAGFFVRPAVEAAAAQIEQTHPRVEEPEHVG
ncbi:MFS transporter [Actinophytocola algeriensis]|uniref:MFS family permease n=1 Tax=Actinophytocola algeriensis TaxID=1768010 RepID=A0A7W7VJ60_9PSEU|nr:MFS transporter [Actinophytocola algeriensis]MBB4912211.1 MFS family permease [Actinophytocola algeriensis]MBE1474273.1 MFS family permease [Actinophytocola algeriensis]